MEWSAVAFDSLVSALVPSRSGAAGHAAARPAAAAPLDLAAFRRLAAERRDLEPYLAMVGTRARLKRRQIAAREGCKVVAFRQRA
ncbi:MAG TPA: hypothetical protein VL244_08965 [Alphaproteobacteria bacterium]|nr:hypothetical protein [Alphaproteobacteria bacterium]